MKEKKEFAWEPQLITVVREAALAQDRVRIGWAADDPRIPPFPYRWEHIQQVARHGRWLLDRVDADDEIVIAACWLHDIKKGEPQHAQRGAEFARTFLPTIAFPTHKIDIVGYAIAQHEGLWRAAKDWQKHQPFRPKPPLKPIEAALLWDADKLSKLGPIAFIHFCAAHLFDLQKAEQTTTTETLVTRQRHWLKHQALRTLASFNTLAAQRKGQELHAANEMYWRVASEGVKG